MVISCIFSAWRKASIAWKTVFIKHVCLFNLRCIIIMRELKHVSRLFFSQVFRCYALINATPLTQTGCLWPILKNGFGIKKQTSSPHGVFQEAVPKTKVAAELCLPWLSHCCELPIKQSLSHQTWPHPWRHRAPRCPGYACGVNGLNVAQRSVIMLVKRFYHLLGRQRRERRSQA